MQPECAIQFDRLRLFAPFASLHPISGSISPTRPHDIRERIPVGDGRPGIARDASLPAGTTSRSLVACR
jgi:hypothetical protein